MDLSSLLNLPPDQLRGLLPRFLAGYLYDQGLRGENQQRISSLVDQWTPEEAQSVFRGLVNLGQQHQVYSANQQARSISRSWCEDVILAPEVHGLDHLRQAAARGRVVILCNHFAYFDATATDAVLSWCGAQDIADRLVFLAGPKVYTALFRRFAALCLNTLPVPQSNRLGHTASLPPRELAQRAIAALQAGKEAVGDGSILLFYPEGSRSRTGRLGSFLPGTHRFLKLADYVIPMALVGTQQIQPVGSDAIHPHPVAIHFGDAIDVNVVGPKKTLGLAYEMITELLPEQYRPPADQAPLG